MALDLSAAAGVGYEAVHTYAAAAPADGSFYSAPEDFASDMRMIFRNAFLYNKPDNFVVIAARELSVKFEPGWAAL